MADDFHVLIQRIATSDRILAIVGAGLSRPSGLPTFRQDPEFWGRPISEIATKSAFLQSPASVWEVYERMRRIAIQARPNAGHEALARLSEAKPNFLTITQNIDGKCTKLESGHVIDAM